jgi:hypothetical protein
MHYFDGDLLLKFCICPFGKVNLSHTADTQGTQYAILPYALSCH